MMMMMMIPTQRHKLISAYTFDIKCPVSLKIDVADLTIILFIIYNFMNISAEKVVLVCLNLRVFRDVWLFELKERADPLSLTSCVTDGTI
jgi:hypothetical protein